MQNLCAYAHVAGAELSLRNTESCESIGPTLTFTRTGDAQSACCHISRTSHALSVAFLPHDNPGTVAKDSAREADGPGE